MRVARILLAVLGLATTAPAWEATSGDEPAPGFVRLIGLDAAKQVYAITNVTVTRFVQETRTRTVTRVVGGAQVQEEVPYTVQIPVQQNVQKAIDPSTHDAYDGTGKPLAPEQLFPRLVDGQLVLMAKTPALPKAYLRLLSPKAVVLVPKPKKKPE